MYMFPLMYKSIFKTPSSHKPPEHYMLHSDFQHPNLNTQDYIARNSITSKTQIGMHDYWNSITVNDGGEMSLVTSNYNCCNWCSGFYSFNQLEDLSADRALYKYHSTELITKIRYIKENLLLVAMFDGQLQLWSTRVNNTLQTGCDELQDQEYSLDTYCLFLLSTKFKHNYPINHLCVCPRQDTCHLAITLSSGNELNVWDLGVGLESLSTIFSKKNINLGMSSGVTAAPFQASLFATCAVDGQATLWDSRAANQSVVTLSSNKSFNWTAINWYCESEHLIHLGTVDGYVRKLDIRQPRRYIAEPRYFEKSQVSHIASYSKNLAVIGDSPAVLKITDGESHEVKYECAGVQERICDVAWLNTRQIITVGGISEKLKLHEF